MLRGLPAVACDPKSEGVRVRPVAFIRADLAYARPNVPHLHSLSLLALAPFICAAVKNYDTGVILQGRN